MARTQKRASIMAAAQTVFLEAGYDAASMACIARRATVSKQTLYNYFGSKNELFGAIIRQRCRTLMESMQPECTANGQPREVLHQLALDFVTKMLAPDTLALYRALVVESRGSAELRAIYYQSGPAFVVDVLAAYFRQESATGRLHVQQPQLAAEQFFAMLGGHLRVRALLGVGAHPSREIIKKYVDNGVALFLNGASA